jgi:hypothetical protein
MKTLLISYASKGREDYHKGLLRLIDSALLFDLDIRVYSPDMAIDSYKGVPILRDSVTPHSEVPYKFKFELIRKAVNDGYKRIVWLDSSLIIKKDLNELFIGAGFCFDNLGHPLCKYISDKSQSNLWLSDSDLLEIPQVWGGAFGLNFNYDISYKVLEDIIKQSELGSFNEGTSARHGFVAHRHDQAVMSVLFNRHGIKMYDYGFITTASHCFEPYEYGNHAYIHHLSI